MATRGVLFDFGYTLFAHATLADTVRACAQSLGAELDGDAAAQLAMRIDTAAMTPDEIRHPRDLDRSVWETRWKILYAIADDEVPGLGEAINRSMHDPTAWVPFQGTHHVVRTLSDRGVPVGVVSNTGWDVRAVFAAHRLDSMIKSFTLSYEAGVVKPDRRIFLAACESIGVLPDQAVMVGDDPRSDGGASAAGMATLLLPLAPLGGDNRLSTVLDLAGG